MRCIGAFLVPGSRSVEPAWPPAGTWVAEGEGKLEPPVWRTGGQDRCPARRLSSLGRDIPVLRVHFERSAGGSRGPDEILEIVRDDAVAIGDPHRSPQHLFVDDAADFLPAGRG